MQTTVINLKVQTDTRTLYVDETFWPLVQYIFFESHLLNVHMKHGITHRFLHYWFYETIQGIDEYTEKQRQKVYKQEGCNYRFSEDSRDFIDWLYDEAKRRDLLFY